MTLGDFLSVCSSDTQLTLLIEGEDGMTSGFCTILVWQLEKLVEVLGLGDAEDISTRIDFFRAEGEERVDVCLKREDEE